MKLITICVLVSLHQAMSLKKCNHYCNLTLALHTLCYPKGGGDDCKNNEKVYLDTAEKRQILNYHNDHRSKVAQGMYGVNMKAGNMMKFVWSGEMGLLAKRWADQCKEGQHDNCRTDYEGKDTGQNSYLGVYKNTGAINEKKVAERYNRLNMMLKTWFQEIELVKQSDIKSFDENRTAVIGNVTQMIWADTIYIGCGYTEFSMKHDMLMFRFVCDYKPKGNIHSKAVFTEGTPCSQCQNGTKCSESVNTLCFNGHKNDFIDDSGAHACKPAFITTALFAFFALIRVFLFPVDR